MQAVARGKHTERSSNGSSRWEKKTLVQDFLRRDSGDSGLLWQRVVKWRLVVYVRKPEICIRMYPKLQRNTDCSRYEFVWIHLPPLCHYAFPSVTVLFPHLPTSSLTVLAFSGLLFIRLFLLFRAVASSPKCQKSKQHQNHQSNVCVCVDTEPGVHPSIHTHTHTHIYIYICICNVCVCARVRAIACFTHVGNNARALAHTHAAESPRTYVQFAHVCEENSVPFQLSQPSYLRDPTCIDSGKGSIWQIWLDA